MVASGLQVGQGKELHAGCTTRGENESASTTRFTGQTRILTATEQQPILVPIPAPRKAQPLNNVGKREREREREREKKKKRIQGERERTKKDKVMQQLCSEGKAYTRALAHTADLPNVPVTPEFTVR